MKVLKFGGTSVGSVAGIRNVKNILAGVEGDKLVVLSAMSGVTNQLVEISELVKTGNRSKTEEKIQELRVKHLEVASELIAEEASRMKLEDAILSELEELQNITSRAWTAEVEAMILTTGERLLTNIFSSFLDSNGVNNDLLDARDFMHVDNLENPDTGHIGELLNESLKRSGHSELLITQGFVRRNRNNEISTLKRGGSDYTATILGAAIRADEIQIWTDINGLHNNDPRYVEDTYPVSDLSFEEAAELAYFGAKILHPQTISPVIGKNIPVYLKNTFTPKEKGTRIGASTQSKGLKAISAKDDITAIKIKSNRMLMAHGFLRKIFEVFDKYETAIDMITTSEIAISLTIDDTRNLERIIAELNNFGEISVDYDHSIICIVGEDVIEDRQSSRLFEILNEVSVRMISYGGSRNNISLLVDTSRKVEVLQKLNKSLFSARLAESI